jgi:hypothetical protein
MQDLEEARRKQECSVCTPLVYIWDPGDGSPGGKPASKIQKFKTSDNLNFLPHLHGSTNNNITVLRPTFPNLRQSSTVHCSILTLRRTGALGNEPRSLVGSLNVLRHIAFKIASSLRAATPTLTGGRQTMFHDQVPGSQLDFRSFIRIFGIQTLDHGCCSISI